LKQIFEYPPCHTILSRINLSIDKGNIFDAVLHLQFPLMEFLHLSLGHASLILRLRFAYPGLGNAKKSATEKGEEKAEAAK
jgi:hypothetical protein